MRKHGKTDAFSLGDRQRCKLGQLYQKAARVNADICSFRMRLMFKTNRTREKKKYHKDLHSWGACLHMTYIQPR